MEFDYKQRPSEEYRLKFDRIFRKSCVVCEEVGREGEMVKMGGEWFCVECFSELVPRCQREGIEDEYL